MSFGPATTQQEIDEACEAIKKAVKALHHSCLILSDTQDNSEFAVDGLQQWVYDQQCTWCYVDKAAGECIVLDMIPELVHKFETLVKCQDYRVNGVLETHRHDGQLLSSEIVRELISEHMLSCNYDHLGWQQNSRQLTLANGEQVSAIAIGAKVLAKLPLPGHTQNSVCYLLGTEKDGQLAPQNIEFAFVGDTLQIGGLGRADLPESSAENMYQSLRNLAAVIADDTLNLPEP